MQGERDTKHRIVAVASVVAVSAACVLGACGSSDSSAGSVASAPTRRVPAKSLETASLTVGRRGGALTVLDHEGFTSIDPGVAHSRVDYEVVDATQRPLFSYQPTTFAEASPDLAAGPAEVSADDETVTVHIRQGVHFSPPVDREVTSADVAYAIERGANPNVANPYFKTYFSGLEGFAKARGGPIAGIATPDKHTIVFHLMTSSGQTLADALALPLSAPVPEEYAKPHDARTPSDYGDYQVATGPYMFESNSDGRVLGIGYRPGKSATLVRNPNWRASIDFRPAYLDSIHIEIGGDLGAIGRRVLDGSAVLENDTPAPAIVHLAHSRFPGQLKITPGAGVRYIAVNNKQGPFAKLDVRKAFWAALNREAMNRPAGGPQLAQVATHFLYPGIPGFAIAESLIAPRLLPYDVHHAGDMAVAAGYMRHAGYTRGVYSGAKTLQVVGSTGEPQAADAQIANQTLKRLGFKTKLTLVAPALMYSKYCGVPAREIDVCPDVGRVADFGDGEAVIYAAFNGNDIPPTGNENWGQVSTPDLISAIEREARVIGHEPREQSWAAVDNGLVGDAAAIPYAWVSEPAIESRDVAGVPDVWNAGAWDYSFTSLK